MQTKKLLVRGARQLLTLRGPNGPRRGAALQQLEIISDGALLIDDGIIEHVGSSRRIENLAAARGAEEINATGRVVMPAFVDSHARIVFAHSGVQDYVDRMAGPDPGGMDVMRESILAGSRAIRAISSRRLRDRAHKVVLGMARHGTCTVEALTGYGLDYAGEMKSLRIHASLDNHPASIISTYFGANVPPESYSSDPGAYLEYMERKLLPVICRRGLARFIDIRCDEGGFSVPLARAFLQAARRYGFGVKVQAGQFRDIGAVELAVEMNAVSVSHLQQISDSQIQRLSRSITMATLLPGSALQMKAERYAPARALIDAGVAVTLASNFNPESSATYNMQMIASLGCRYLQMTPEEVISAATINGAHALRFADRTGSLEANKYADVLILDVPDYREIPNQIGVNNVHLVLKRGRPVYYESGE